MTLDPESVLELVSDWDHVADIADLLELFVLRYAAKHGDGRIGLLLTTLDRMCENDDERLTLHSLINRVSFLGACPYAPDVFDVDLVGRS